MKRCYRCIALILTMCIVLTGCGNKQSDSDAREIKVKLNETIDADSDWIDSCIEGAIDENTPTNLKDDFYTYVNKEYILESMKDIEDSPVQNFATEGDEIVANRLKAIIFETEDPEANLVNTIGYDQSEVDYDNKLVVRFTNTAADWEARKVTGYEPLKRYLDKIDEIETLDELSEFVSKPYTDNFTGVQFVKLSNSGTYNDPVNNHVQIDLFDSYIMNSSNPYYKWSMGVEGTRNAVNDIGKYMLTRAGYSESEATRMLANCYKFESMLADAQRGVSSRDYKENETYYSLEETQEIFGDYPISSILENRGLLNDEGYVVVFPQSAKKVAGLYKTSNLQLMTDFYRVHTTLGMVTLLDRDTYDMYVKTCTHETKDITKDGDTREMESDDEELNILLNEYAYKYMNEPLDAVYVSRYCSSEQKEELTNLVHTIVDYYAEMIDGEEWLSKEAKEATKEKLRAMKMNILYPDSYPSYRDVEFADADTLPDMVAKLWVHDLNQESAKVGQAYNGAFAEMSTTTLNAYYMAQNNSVNILAGIVTPPHMYDLNDPIEVRLANLGTIVGHEISHGFDDTGVHFDKDGYEQVWWSAQDQIEYSERTAKLQSFYSAIIPYPGGKTYNGTTVSGEAIADMGGMKCMIGIGHTIEGFDYDLFFKSYAQLWRGVATYDQEKMMAEDVHPLMMLRANVTVQQFEEFYDTYDIKPGDGMYLEPDKRINVW